MNRKVQKSLPATAQAVQAARQRGALIDTSKGLTAVKTGHFETNNEELFFAKYYSKFQTNKKRSPR